MMINQLMFLLIGLFIGLFIGGLFGYTMACALEILKVYELYDYRDFFCVFFEDHFFLSVFYGGFTLFIIIAAVAVALR